MEHQAIETTGATESTLRANCEAHDLKAAFVFMARHIVEKRNTIPILDCVMIEGAGNALRISATDLGIQASIDIAADVEQPGRVAVPLKELSAFIIKALSCKGARVDMRENRDEQSPFNSQKPKSWLVLSSGRGKATLLLQKPDDFPMIADPLSAGYEAKAFVLSAEYADRLATLPQFCGTDDGPSNFRRAVDISVSDGAMIMSATDGLNASIWRCASPAGADGTKMLIARKPVKSICAARDAFAKDSALSVQSTDNRIIVQSGNCRIIAKLCEYDTPENLAGTLDALAGNVTPLIIPDIDPLISAKAIALFDKQAGKSGLLWEGGEAAARITRPDAPDWTGYASNLKTDSADKGNTGVTLQIGTRQIGIAKDNSGITLSAEAVAKLCGDDLFAVIPVALPGDVLPYQSDRRAYVTKWLYLAGATKFRTVPSDGKVHGEKTAWLRHPMTRDQVDACLSPEQRAALIEESQVVAPEPVIRLLPVDVFKRDYSAAWAERDAAAMIEAIRAFKAYRMNAAASHLSAVDVAADVNHQIRTICAGIRGLGEKVRPLGKSYRYGGYGFKYGVQQLDCAHGRILRTEANRQAKSDWLTSGGIHAGDPRTIVQIEYQSGGETRKGFAHVNALRDPSLVTIPLCRKTGTVIKNAVYISAVKVLPGVNADERKAVADAIAAYDTPVVTPTDEPAPVATLSDELDANGLPDAETCKAMLNAALSDHFAPPESATETPQDDAPATTLTNEPVIALCEPEIVPSEAIEAQPDVMAALILRIEALELALSGAALISATTIEAAKVIAPIAELADIEPLPVDPRALAVSRARQEVVTPLGGKRTAAHIRAIMAYLAMRKARDGARYMARLRTDTLENANRSIRHWRDGAQKLGDQLQESGKLILNLQAQLETERTLSASRLNHASKRRRAVLKARDLQTRLYAEYKILDKANERSRANYARAELAETALAAVQARADGWPPAVRSLNVKFRMAA